MTHASISTLKYSPEPGEVILIVQLLEGTEDQTCPV